MAKKVPAAPRKPEEVGGPRVVVTVRMLKRNKAIFNEWGGAAKLEGLLNHWRATRDGKRKAGLPA